jgi:NAD(P)-dependent dehydrogenase (short-subunit alcohol dehydrogenase family)
MKNKTILITGAGTGIGKSIANNLSELGYSLILLGRNLSRLEETKKNLKFPDQCQIFSSDVRDSTSIKDALIKSSVESLYGAVINAGSGGENNYGANDRWQEVIEINLTGSYNTTQECLPYLRKDPNPFKKILFISSILARLGVPGYTAYCASKAGILGLMRSFAAELSGENILVNALCPGWVNTDMAHEGLDGMASGMAISKEEAYKMAMSQVPLGKMSEPDEIGKMTAFMLSDNQNSITGQTIDINNGALMP